MHGIVFGELKQYVAERLGPSAWNELLADAGIGPKLYLAIQEYPDEELGAILQAACRRTGLSAAAVLQDFGDFIGPHLVRMYRMYILPEWKTLDVIEHTEERIHKMVRVQHRGARPPYLSTTRRNADEIVVHYSSERRLCALAKGIALGIARHYGETLDVRDLTCMHKGAATCEILLTRRDAA
ncbi:MAG TPA: heme NO-binding domain-containing protein [Thermoanaerobaculia bacterium]|nr:heme NO-binding domain-containing protein [Thermoanaerobaculia bacterium]